MILISLLFMDYVQWALQTFQMIKVSWNTIVVLVLFWKNEEPNPRQPSTFWNLWIKDYFTVEQ